MPPRSRMAVDTAAEATPAEPAVDETPAPAEDTPAVADPPAAPDKAVVTCVRATEAFTASYGCQMLTFAAGEIARGAIAVFLSTAGVPVEPVDED